MSSLKTGDRTLLTAQLDDALDHDLCPICFLARTHEYRRLDMLLYECINDLGTRRELKRSRGLCVYHTYQLLDVGGYGIHAKIAILFRDLVGDMTRELAEMNVARPTHIDMEVGCPICDELRQTESDFATIMVSYLADAERRERFARSFGLCLRHFYQVAERADRKLRTLLRDDQQARLEALSGDLAEFIRKSVVQDEPFGSERDVWIRVLRTYAGTLRLDERLDREEVASASPDEALT